MSDCKNRVASVTGIQLPFPVEVREGENLHVQLKDYHALIEASEPTAVSRGYFLLSRAVKEGKDCLDVHQSRHFASCGPMLDMSRNAVLRVSAVKEHIDRLAALGLNMLMLYTEDTYEVPEYPSFGLCRGRYTQAELREIDAYAADAGIELIPCIQTLAHLGTFLRWNANWEFRDQDTILMIDSEETYKLIDAMLRSLRSCFRTDKIHIGMDEAHGVGLGRYLQEHGMVDRFELLTRHLARVSEICKKYDFHPMMWSDMFFRLGSKNNEYYDMNAHIPQSVIDSLPDVDMVYWDYYHENAELYTAMLREHARMKRNTIFAGGNWTWSGFVPNTKKTRDSMLPGLRASCQEGVNMVIATEWGDDGGETPLCLADFMLPMFSEVCWQGPDASEEEMTKAAMCLTGFPADYPSACAAFYPGKKYIERGKGLVWCDPLLPLMPMEDVPLDRFADGLGQAQEIIARLPESPEKTYLKTLYAACEKKARLLPKIRIAYTASKRTGDRAPLKQIAAEDIPALRDAYHDLALAHRTLWLRDCKPQGWEMISVRYGGVMGRLEDTALTLSSYANHEMDEIAELEEVLPEGYMTSGTFFGMTSAGAAFNV